MSRQRFAAGLVLAIAVVSEVILLAHSSRDVEGRGATWFARGG